SCCAPSPGRYLAKTCDPVGNHDVGLQDVEDVLFQHPLIFVYPAIILSAGNRNTDKTVQLGKLVKGIPRSRLFEPDTIQAFQFSGGFQRPAKIPNNARLPRSE